MKCVFTALAVTLYFSAPAQQRYNAPLLDTLTEICHSNTTSKYFAQLYQQAIEATNKFAADEPDSVRQFVIGFESYFGPSFFRSYHNLVNNSRQIEGWKFYYSHSSLNEMQYKFLGMNAHINGDMWIALKEKYNYDSLKKYRHPLISFQKALNVFFDSIYTTTGNYKKLKRLHFFTLGLDKKIGRKILLHWRKKQVELAMLYYSDPKKWKRKLKNDERRIHRWNRFALNWIK